MPQRPEDTPNAPYVRVLNALTAEIEAKTYAPGDPIPSESELCKRHKVARMTVRRAVGILRDRGLVYTEWGKGSFVAKPAAKRQEEEPRPPSTGEAQTDGAG